MTNANVTMDTERRDPEWKFLTNHALVLAWIEMHPQSTARETAQAIGITERTALKIIGELDTGHYISRRRKGRRNVYHVIRETPLRDPLIAGTPIGELLKVIAPKAKRHPAEAVAEEATPMRRLRRARRTA